MLKIIFRILFLGLGIFVVQLFGKEAVLPVWHRVTGKCVTGKVVGFLAGGWNSKTVLAEPTGVRKGKRRARRPVFRYPNPAIPGDSLQAHASSGTFLIFGTWKVGDTVPVVYNSALPAEGRIFSFQLIFMALLGVLLGLFMLRIAVLGRLD